MIQITKNEAQWLADKGYRWGEILHHTYTKHKKYYVTERPDVMRKIKKYRERQIVKS